MTGHISKAVRERFFSYLQRAFETFYQDTIAVDRQGIINWISDDYCRFLGLAEPPLGKHITDVIPGSYVPQVLASGEPVLLDLLQIRNQWVLVSVIPLHNEAGEIEGAFGFVATDSRSGMKSLLEKYNLLQREVRNASRFRDSRTARYQLSQVAGQSDAMRLVKEQIRQAARFDVSVLLTGETGTGKELFAHALHDLSSRADKPFVSINVAAIPETLIEAEFFGVAPGAFTGAKKEGRPGKLEIAADGTLFLDEIGDMPLALQAKLLRVLQEREFERVGSNEVQRTDVRIVAATSRNLLEMVDSGEFRADLYYRLSAMPIQLPALRDRLSDLEALSERILDECCTRLGVTTKVLTGEGLALLSCHSWPGNVRELYNVLERACILNENSAYVDASALSVLLPGLSAESKPLAVGKVAGLPQPMTEPRHTGSLNLKERLREAEQRAIREALQLTGGNRSEAARLLGISRAALYQKLGRGEKPDAAKA
ncbi:sigma-54 interaction domain-containing protein [Marinobacterium ramblicola]|uniref:sigma-54 interaction domain-containing protein n=1 Tax=Marinobacterium ramblicola TaxID=2849041 RepID=UPI001FE3A13A|nr:sigma 54-interacting transcriptional regulator [Marinobacterium ramblicola]